MRLHHLEIRAFGPFADPVSVDFDALSGAGLFLLTGATGSGKTSILDAVCFALYGDVPGDRSAAKRLRSDQAAPGLAPEVILEATVSGRRVRITRSPAWERPKLRGPGLTTQQASVVVAERVDGIWATLSTRLDETGHLIGELVGLNLDQFCQVAMLPQGRFQAFLRARSEDRHKLLQQLFRTGRFEGVERWLRDHRLGLRRASEAQETAVADLVSRLSETAAPDPLALEAPPLDDPAGTAVVEEWAGILVRSATSARERLEREVAIATSGAAIATAAREAGQLLAERQARHAAARAELARLDRTETAHRRAVASLDASGRATRVIPVVELADTTRARAFEARAIEASACADVAGLGVDADAVSALAQTRDESLAAAAEARALVPREERLASLRRGVENYAVRISHLDEELVRHDTTLARLPERVERCRVQHAAATAAVAALPGVEAAGADLHKRVSAAAQHAALVPQLAEARTAQELAVGEAQRLTEVWLSLREQRLDGMAAEMAVSLVVGGGCPVCGSEHHPHPASAHSSAPDAEAERQARKQVDDAESSRHVYDEHVRDLTTRIALAELLAGSDRTRLAERVAQADTELVRVRALAESKPQLEAELRSLEAQQSDVARRRDAGRLERSGVVSAEATQRAEIAAISEEVHAALRDTDDSDLATRASRLSRLAGACDQALTARGRAEQAWAEASRTADTVATALAESGFADAAAARAARLAAADVIALSDEVREHEAARLAASRIFDDLDLAQAAAADAPDLDSLRSVDARRREAAALAATESRVAGARSDRLDRLYDQLVAALRAWRPVRDELDVVTRLSAFVDGRSPDNRLQMRLSAYVLAHRLSQVVDAANERLATMSDQRYSLAHTGRRGAGENRGGLSLLVRDDWSGESRDPATLSGGETFVVSLALALGLADVITQESESGAAGDSRLDTLFVDEGFGSLDADTLDDVMDTLDSLREGGRVVGVVSHVAEMRDRIPCRLEVTKSRRGSRVRGPGDPLPSSV
ncbi:MAG: AAA family ATPase [Nocardioides sp.]